MNVAVQLVVVNLLFAGLVVFLVGRWRSARRDAAPVDPDGSVTVRLRQRPWDDDLAERCVRRGMGSAAYVPTGAGGWGDRSGSAARVTPPVVGDRATLIEVSTRHADAVVAGMVAVLVNDGYEVSRQRGRRVRLRRGPDRAELQVGPG
jgi:hypothetical protein